MQSIIDFFENLLTWHNQLVSGASTLEILSFWIGAVSFVMGIAATVYSYQSAKRSDRLLRRLIVYPFRELDLAISKLPPVQSEELIQLYRMSGGKRRFTLSDAIQVIGQFGEVSLNLLVKEEWLRREGKDRTKFRINPDRRAYLAFYIEASQDTEE